MGSPGRAWCRDSSGWPVRRADESRRARRRVVQAVLAAPSVVTVVPMNSCRASIRASRRAVPSLSPTSRGRPRFERAYVRSGVDIDLAWTMSAKWHRARLRRRATPPRPIRLAASAERPGDEHRRRHIALRRELRLSAKFLRPRPERSFRLGEPFAVVRRPKLMPRQAVHPYAHAHISAGSRPPLVRSRAHVSRSCGTAATRLDRIASRGAGRRAPMRQWRGCARARRVEGAAARFVIVNPRAQPTTRLSLESA